MGKLGHIPVCLTPAPHQVLVGQENNNLQSQVVEGVFSCESPLSLPQGREQECGAVQFAGGTWGQESALLELSCQTTSPPAPCGFVEKTRKPSLTSPHFPELQ